MSFDYLMSSGNPLLMKDDVGKAKPTYYDLPSQTFCYGKAEYIHEGGTAECMTWKNSVPRVVNLASAPTDFRILNKMSCKLKAATVKAQADLRKGGEVKIPKLLPNKPDKSRKEISLPMSPLITPGKAARPSTPIAKVVGNHFACEYEKAAKERYAEIDAELEGKRAVIKIKTNKSYHYSARGKTHARRRAQTQVAEKKKPEFKIKKFDKVPAKFVLPGGPHDPEVIARKAATKVGKEGGGVSAGCGGGGEEGDMPEAETHHN